MAVELQDVVAEIEKSAPLSFAEEWDNSGWQIRLFQGEDAQVSRILVALEIRNGVIDEAIEKGAELVLTHHPLFFAPIKCIDMDDLSGGYAARLAKAGISLYSAHTSFDAAPGGMNDCLGKLIGLADLHAFPEKSGADAKMSGLARSGELEQPIGFPELCERVGNVLGMQGRLRVSGEPSRIVKTGAVCGGSGGDFVPDAIKAKLDFLLTSDIKHHQAAQAKENGLCLIDGGHFGTENLFAREMAGRLRTAFGSALEVFETAANLDPWQI